MAAPLRNEFWPSLKSSTASILSRHRQTYFLRVFSSETTADTKRQPSSSQTNYSPHSNPPSTVSTSNGGNGRLGHFMQMYEDFVGLTEVKQAQSKVVDAESQFLEVQENRRVMQHDLVGVQTEVRSIGNDLEKTHRTDPCYIDLVRKEHEILLVEKDMNIKIKALDKAERDYFSLLSAAVRESHEKERARAERTKYWSVIGSVIGAIIGITGSTWNNRMRLKEMRAIITESGETAASYKAMVSELVSQHSSESARHEELSMALDRNEDASHGPMVNSHESLQDAIREQTDLITRNNLEQTQVILSDLNDVKKILSLYNSEVDVNSVIYVGPEMKQMLEETKTDLQSDSLKKMVTVSVLGCFLTVGLSLLAAFTKGS